MLYDKIIKSWKDGDMTAWRECLHDDWEMLFHSSGRIARKGDANPEEWASFVKTLDRKNQRCLYENDDILVIHEFITFPSGHTEAVMNVSIKKDGLLWRTETGATPINPD